MTCFLELWTSIFENVLIAKSKSEVGRRLSSNLKCRGQRVSLYDQVLSVKAGTLKTRTRRTDFGVGLPPLAFK